MRQVIIIISLFVIVLTSGSQNKNVLLIIADDLGVDYSPGYNSPLELPPTPTLDSLIQNGIVFNNAWSNPLCSPTRSTILTGRYAFRTGVGAPVGGGSPGTALSEKELPEVLKENLLSAPATACIGKWHLSDNANGGANHPNNAGFDYYSGNTGGGLPDYFNYTKVVQGDNVTVSNYASSETVNDAVNWIREQNGNWFLWLAYNAVHLPLHKPPVELHSYDNAPDTVQVTEDNYTFFKAMIEAMDTETGRLLDSLRAFGELENTEIIFVGDNGTPKLATQRPFRKPHSKGSLFQGGVQVPMVVAGPSVNNAGRTSSELVNLSDIYATVLDMYGINVNEVLNDIEHDSRSLLPVLQNTGSNGRDFIFSEIFNSGELNGKTIRNETFHLIRYDTGSELYFNLNNDVYEINNLLENSLDAESQENYNELSAILDSLLGKKSARVYPEPTESRKYLIVDTDQSACYDSTGNRIINCAGIGEDLHGQDSQHSGNKASYTDNEDGTITDNVTGLMWVKARGDKMTWNDALEAASNSSVAGYNDWRLPTIKELYSLIMFTGVTGTSITTSVPYLNTNYFEFEFGDESAGERFIDCQDWSSTVYVGTTMNGDTTVFGVNFADGRIKGYPKYKPRTNNTEGSKMFVRFVRGNTNYGLNLFEDNNDNTISDLATGLMWAKEDSKDGMNWPEALKYIEKLNRENYLGYSDWRLPNAKEMQSILEYSQAPFASQSENIGPAIQPVFSISQFENGDYPWFWTSTTHIDGGIQNQTEKAVYICFGRATGFMERPPGSGSYTLLDVHGAGAQRSDPKTGNPDDYPNGFGPQGDEIRIYNYVRPVRDIESETAIENPSDKSNNQLKISPNPSSGDFHLSFYLNHSENLIAECYDLGGSLVDLKNISARAGLNNYLWNIKADNGLYLVLLRCKAQTLFSKLVIE